jgi:hypothetical protein
MWRKIREILLNMLFLWAVFQIAYTNKDANAFAFKTSTARLISRQQPGCIQLNNVSYKKKIKPLER